jgi:hypothetical protein
VQPLQRVQQALRIELELAFGARCPLPVCSCLAAIVPRRASSGYRLTFVCPQCGQFGRHLYVPRICCRGCAGPDYQCRHVAQNSVVHVVIGLRQRIPGAAHEPFGFPPRFKRRHVQRLRLVDQVCALEARLLAELCAFNGRLAKLVQRYRD